MPNLTRAEQMEVERQAELAAIAGLRKARAAKRKAKERSKHAPGKWTPGLRDIHNIKIMLAAGLSHTQIAGILRITLPTLQKQCGGLLTVGADEANAKVAAKLFQKCMRGDTIAMIYWTKTRLGWREVHRTEHTGADGGPIQHQTVAAQAEAFKQRIAQLAERHKAAANDGPESQPDSGAPTATEKPIKGSAR